MKSNFNVLLSTKFARPSSYFSKSNYSSSVVLDVSQELEIFVKWHVMNDINVTDFVAVTIIEMFQNSVLI